MARKTLFTFASLVLTSLLLAGCYHQKKTTTNTSTPTVNTGAPTTNASQPSTTAPSTSSVAIRGYAFSPSNITVKKGTTVTWTNQDRVQHTVTGDSGGPGSGLLSQGQIYTYTFDTAGTFAYHCTPHSYMKATVEVIE